MSIGCVILSAVNLEGGERVSIYRNIQNKCREQGKTIMGIEMELLFPRGSIYKWDTNRPSVLKVKAVADLLGTTVDELLQETDKV